VLANANLAFSNVKYIKSNKKQALYKSEATIAQNPNSENWRCILNIARMEFAAFGGVGGGQKSRRLRREH